MGINRNDILQVLNFNEIPILERAEAAGVLAGVFYTKLRAFQTTYPESWEREVESWLKTAKVGQDQEARVNELKAQIKAKKIALLERSHQSEEDALKAELEQLDERLGTESAPARAVAVKAKKEA